jgi:hypothetical protein
MDKQLYLDIEPDTQRIERAIKELINQSERVRKSQFAQIAELTRLYHETKHDLDNLKIAICKYQHGVVS